MLFLHKFTIDLAVPADIPVICALYDELFTAMATLQPQSYQPAEQDRDFLKAVISGENSVLFVARSRGKLLGFALAQEQYTPLYGCIVPHRYAYLMDLLVGRAQRSRGIGSALLDAVERWAKSRGLDYLELNVLEENTRAMLLYQMQGYTSTARTMRKSLKK